eukprot:gene4293-20493_t
MGLFAEISRAWLAIDSDIYVWNFEDGTDVAYFDGLDEVILTAGLITPKPGVFQEHIQFLLCIATPFSIVVLGVSFSEEKDGKVYGEMHLQPQPLFTVPTDNVFMTSTAGLWNGRIFLSGADGCLYELAYQAQSSWFRQKCSKINHTASWMSILVPSFVSKAFTSEDPVCQIAVDNTRNILYGRTENGNIQVYDAGEDGTKMRHVSCLSSNSIAVNASYVAKNLDKKHIQRIIHIAPVSKAEASQVHLVAITDTGVRLYFSTTNPANPEGRPCLLRLVHVRLPPGFTPSGTTSKPSKVHQAFYRQGTTLMLDNSSEENDVLWCLSQESFPFENSIKESQVSSAIEGKTWCVSEIPDYSNPNHIPEAFFSCLWPEPPAIVNQHVLPRRRFVLLSPKGSHVVTTLRPFEQLRELFINSGNGMADSIETFFQFYGVTQACAMCLVLICQSPEAEKEIVNRAVQAFFRYDYPSTLAGQRMPSTGAQTAESTVNITDASFMFGGPVPAGSAHGSYLASPVQKKLKPQSVGSQFQTSTPATGLLAKSGPQPSSGKYSGIALYLARILRPVWNHLLVYIDYPDGRNQQLVSRLSSEDLSWFIESLRKLKEFMERYSNLELLGSPTRRHDAVLSSQVAGRKRNLGDQEAVAVERNALVNLANLISMCCEALELWRTLCDNQFHIVAQNLPQELKEKLAGLSFKEFVLNGQEISAALIGCLMARYLDDQATVDALNSQLREICPTLFSIDDAIYAKANEIVHFARHVLDPAERNTLLAEAISMYFKVPGLLDLTWICEQLQSVRHFDGIIELALYAAVKRDPQNVALHYYKAGEPRDDTQGKEAFILRCDAYNCILNALSHIFEKSSEHPHSLPTEPGPPVQPDVNALSVNQAKHLFDQTLKVCLQSDDELFHVTLYKWMMTKELTDRLIEISSPFLQTFIVDTAAEKHPNDIPILDLLWKYHQKHKQYIQAAKVLIGLAERQCTSLVLQERVAYISRAIMCAKNSLTFASSNTEGEFLHELEEKLEVARIQYQVYQALNATNVGRSLIQEKADAIKLLDTQLVDISQLYGDFADRFDLLECKLAILHCAGHQDKALIENIWKQLIDKAVRVDGRMAAVSQVVISTGKMYVTSQGFFPLAFILFYLEKVSCENSWDPTWVFVTLREVGLSMKQLWLAYDKLLKSKEAVWQASGKPLHLLNAISLFIKTYLDNTTVVPSSERPAFNRSLCEACSGYLVELESMSESNTLVKNLLSRFRGVIAQLKR